MTREEQISNGFTEMMKGFWGNQDLKVPDFEEPCKQEPCEDCISRQAVLDTTICDGISCNECSFNICENGKSGCLLDERISKLPPVIPQPKWIPVSEGLPNFNDVVLASTDSNYDESKVIIIVYNADEFWFNGRIKAWMPLPKPYRAESEVNNADSN